VRRRRRRGLLGQRLPHVGDDLVYGGSTAAPTPSASATLAPETAAYRDYGNRVYQAKWTAPAHQQLLSKRRRVLPQPLGRQSRCRARDRRQPDPRRRAVRDGLRENGNIPRLTYRSATGRRTSTGTRSGTPASLVTGSHSVKVGYQGALLYDDRKNFTNSSSCSTASTTACPIS
jgi:hypothetical protein